MASTIVLAQNPVRVLMAEDDEPSGQLIVTSLHARGYEIHWCQTGASCLNAIRNAPILGAQVLLLDLGLPDMGGEELLREIAAVAPPDLRVIIITASLARGEERSFLEHLAPELRRFIHAVLVKPFEMSSLENLIASADHKAA